MPTGLDLNQKLDKQKEMVVWPMYVLVALNRSGVGRFLEVMGK